MNSEATDALMATLGEYDALWDGELFPEIVDAEYHDCYDERYGTCLTIELLLRYDVETNEEIERIEAMEALMGAVDARVGTLCRSPLFTEEVDAELYDCPLDMAGWYDYYIDPPVDWPSVESLK